jgi:hypothetical protein
MKRSKFETFLTKAKNSLKQDKYISNKDNKKKGTDKKQVGKESETVVVLEDKENESA